MQKCVISPKQLLCEAKTDPLGISTSSPCFSWKNKASSNKAEQIAYQILVAGSPALLTESEADLWNTGEVGSSESVWIPYKGTPLQSGLVAYWKTRVWDQNSVESRWSETARFSVGLLHASDWTGEYIGMETNSAADTSPLLRKTFLLGHLPDEIFLHVNSLGYHELYVNDRKVGHAVLAPAESQFNKRSFSLSYDLSSYLVKGKNAIVLWLGYGWYEKAKERPHEGPLVRAQLEGLHGNNRKTLERTDGNWAAVGSGYSYLGPEKWSYGGEIVDAGKMVSGFSDPDLDDSDWQKATVFKVPDHLVSPQVVELNRVHQSLQAVEIREMDTDQFLIDMGRNFTGGLTILFPALPKGHQVPIQYSDKFSENEDPQYGAQRDRYISSGAEGVFETRFGYHGFRYVRISNMPAQLKTSDIVGHLIHTDFKEAIAFSCSDELLNKLHDMFAYTLKCLALGGKIVDCPHLERLGYGGDGNACTKTALTMFDLSPLYTTWLTHWADGQKANGAMPHTAPSYWGGGGMWMYWETFMVKAAWETYLSYGDIRVLEQFYPSMLKWVEYIRAISPDVLVDERPDPDSDAWHLGDWATPKGVDKDEPQSVSLVTNCAVLDAYDKMIKIAIALGKDSDAKSFLQKKEELARAVHAAFYNSDSATYATGVQIDLAYPLILGVVPGSLIEKVTESLLSETLEKRKGHFGTGLVGLPVLTQWAVSNEAAELMYLMMTKKDYPGFGYMVENGATTTWEHWDGARSRIHNCYHGAGSWFYLAIGGIQPLEDFPGYRRFVVAPRPPESLTWAEMSKETPYGTITIAWQKEDGKMKVQLGIPVGSTACLVLPNGTENCGIDSETREPDQDGNILIESGNYCIEYQLETASI